MALDTLLTHADDNGELGVAPSIHPSVPFAAQSTEAFAEMATRPRHAQFYRRYGNPTQSRLEQVLAKLEGAEAALVTASGMGAITTTVLSLVSAGDHIVAQRSLYSGALALLQDVAPGLGIDVTFVDQTDIEQFLAAIRNRTKLIMLESPSNPLLQVTDLAAVASIAKQRGIVTAVDSTVGTPINQRPLDVGIDLVIHSLTKFISGHADVLAGVVLGRQALIESVWNRHIIFGSVVSPFDAWLTLRGLRTLRVRVECQNSTALALAKHLDDHPAIERVNYPGLPSHPQHSLAARQMSGFSGLLSFELAGGYSAAEALLGELQLFSRSASLGGVRSLVVQPAAMWAQDLTPDQIAESGVVPGLVRVAVGLEDPHDLIADVDRALARISTDATP